MRRSNGQDSIATTAPRHTLNEGRIARNVLANWAGHAVAIAAGFIIPRVIDNHLGQEHLGIWDLSWSLVHALPLLLCGTGTAVNRFVARQRAADDRVGLNQTISACLAVFTIAALLAMVVALILAQCVTYLLPNSSAALVTAAQWTVLLLGATVAFQMIVGVYNGVITGLQRYETVTLIESGGRIAGIAAIVITLVSGGGLIALCTVVLVRELVVGLFKYIAAHRLCPHLAPAPRHLQWSTVKTVLVFGGKSYLAVIGEVILLQGNRIILLGFLGPAALAIFSRPMGLVRSMHQMVFHFSRVMTPVASEVQVRGTPADLADLLTRANRLALLIALPPAAILAIYGGPILRVWMGTGYAVGSVLAILALGQLASSIQLSAYYILVGMGRHGVAALAAWSAAVASVILTTLLIGVFQWGLYGAAVGIALPLLIVNTLIMPMYLLRVLKLPLGRYVRSFVDGCIPALPFIVTLAMTRWLMPGNDAFSLLGGVGVGLAILLVTYVIAVPEIRQLIGRKALRRARQPEAPGCNLP